MALRPLCYRISIRRRAGRRSTWRRREAAQHDPALRPAGAALLPV